LALPVLGGMGALIVQELSWTFRSSIAALPAWHGAVEDPDLGLEAFDDGSCPGGNPIVVALEVKLRATANHNK
jgi:hypothetical protein